MRSDGYQIVLIALGAIAAVLFGAFFVREVFPEYKIYQQDYLALEEFRSSYTGQPIPPFKGGVDQIVLEREDKGPPVIDRCTSCHVALQIPYFSPTKSVMTVMETCFLMKMNSLLKYRMKSIFGANWIKKLWL